MEIALKSLKTLLSTTAKFKLSNSIMKFGFEMTHFRVYQIPLLVLCQDKIVAYDA